MQLTKLWLQSNKLVSLPRTIGNLASLQDLRVGENNLNSIPEEIGLFCSIYQINRTRFRPSGLVEVSLPQRQLVPSLAALRVGAVLLPRDYVHRELSPQPDPARNYRGRTVSSNPGSLSSNLYNILFQYLKMQGPYRGVVLTQ